ncbi:hydrogen peroxide-dependent heme synthase [Lipingzhangella sp. LS1_29]|uniref:Coproheme decarboxylase n=1 Tax=Lipingzhangella rawalii TaxID=2055835 RepID=A0ABU2H0M4_9ACTN|nr:hydrogen peroxide-dependent heme synthase [Lipingzhangella rawalii]MDS1268863.1 hydrogen peroxide-dependent heme synthase [Lipingzhangella rawalii]
MSTESAQGSTSAQNTSPEELNSLIRYTMWSVFKAGDLSAWADADRVKAGAEVATLFDEASTSGVTTRGVYDVQGLRSDADLMVWWVASNPDDLQRTYVELRRTSLGRMLTPVWSAMGIHRPAEFNRAHVPAFLAGEEPRDYLCVYPFVRSYEWYLLPAEERSAMLAEHGRMAAGYGDVRANTVSSFALSDYEWLLGFEADELHRIVDLMRHLRGAAARRHTRLEVPFFTGRRTEVGELVTRLP